LLQRGQKIKVIVFGEKEVFSTKNLAGGVSQVASYWRGRKKALHTKEKPKELTEETTSIPLTGVCASKKRVHQKRNEKRFKGEKTP